ncbi:ribosomal subunit interface protein [Sulfurovum sp. TSL6]|uniref:RNA 3'-terminal phosphate cyclase n=1 Tax=Sulfurovum sp. TSL6 TaxID=2826995 RepID=UPI001CC4A1CB|nr:RNA 3'-terminal phosphate cyclase [Sulfurovum sp. TSL6]GIU00317.1 ribosomal subunit interface protein [Sulfurovum sp. TSL6]
MKTWVEIDGSFGEGGGQVIRTSLTLSALTGKPVAIHNIRKNRPNPGLAPQHLTNVLALAEICDANVEGAEIGSMKLLFEPQAKPRADRYIFDVTEAAQKGSAGSVTLILQTLLLPLALTNAKSHLVLRGGTNVAWSPPYEYIAHVFLPMLERMGIKAQCRLNARGFYPVGGGEMTVEIFGSASLMPLKLTERGNLQRIWGNATACNLPAHIPQRMADRAGAILKSSGFSAEITPRRERCVGSGAGIFLTVQYEHALAGFSALGKPGKYSEEVAEEACAYLIEYHKSGASVDRYLADQLLLPMSLADGVSELKTDCISRHLVTNAHIIRQFIAVDIFIDAEVGEPGRIIVSGATVY